MTLTGRPRWTSPFNARRGPGLAAHVLLLLAMAALLACGNGATTNEQTNEGAVERPPEQPLPAGPEGGAAGPEPTEQSPAAPPGVAPDTDSPAGDREALVALYHATGGANWNRNDNWLSDAPLGEWNGVNAYPNDHVFALNLAGTSNWLKGEIPPELGNLSHLVFLQLNINQLSGEIPPELGSLSNLERLNLSDNDLSGEIPTELGNLPNMERLILADNQLSGEIPSELGSLSNLVYLQLQSNRLGGEIPPELGSLSNVRILDLRDNQLNGEIPPELGNLSHEVSLLLDGNQLSGCIPGELRANSASDLERLGLPFCE